MKYGISVCANHTPAFALIAEGWNDLVQDGYTPDWNGICPVRLSDKVIYATNDDGEVVGVLCYNHCLERTIEVTLAYVEPSSRGNGIFKGMWGLLVERTSQDFDAALLSIHPNNKLGMAAVRGLKPAPSIALRFKLEV